MESVDRVFSEVELVGENGMVSHTPCQLEIAVGNGALGVLETSKTAPDVVVKGRAPQNRLHLVCLVDEGHSTHTRA